MQTLDIINLTIVGVIIIFEWVRYKKASATITGLRIHNTVLENGAKSLLESNIRFEALLRSIEEKMNEDGVDSDAINHIIDYCKKPSDNYTDKLENVRSISSVEELQRALEDTT